MDKEITVKSVVLDMYAMTQSERIFETDTGQEITLQDLQDLFYQNIDQLADLLGIDLDEEE